MYKWWDHIATQATSGSFKMFSAWFRWILPYPFLQKINTTVGNIPHAVGSMSLSTPVELTKYLEVRQLSSILYHKTNFSFRRLRHGIFVYRQGIY